AAHDVVHLDAAGLGDAESDRGPAPLALQSCRVGSREPAAGAVVARRLAPRQSGLALRLEVLGRAEAAERGPGIDQPHGVVAVERPALALAVRPCRAGALGPLDARTLLPLQAEPQEVLDDLGLRTGDVP